MPKAAWHLKVASKDKSFITIIIHFSTTLQLVAKICLLMLHWCSCTNVMLSRPHKLQNFNFNRAKIKAVCLSVHLEGDKQLLTSQSIKIILSSSLWKAILPFFSYAAHILEAIAAVTFASLSPDPAYDSNDPS